MNKKIRVLIIGLAVFISIFLVISFLHSENSDDPASVKAFITANPLDISQTKAISQFRSCEGHNYSGHNANGIEETYRTMKHYVEVASGLDQTAGQVKIYAPFDGRISQISKDPRGSQVYLSPEVKADGWDFLFFHVDLLPQFNKEGTDISTGDHIGYANLINGANFDIALRSFGFRKQRNGSPFNFMTQSVLSEYSESGITLENIIITKQARDSAPCQLAPGESGRDAFYARSEVGKSWINLK